MTSRKRGDRMNESVEVAGFMSIQPDVTGTREGWGKEIPPKAVWPESIQTWAQGEQLCDCHRSGGELRKESSYDSARISWRS